MTCLWSRVGWKFTEIKWRVSFGWNLYSSIVETIWKLWFTYSTRFYSFSAIVQRPKFRAFKVYHFKVSISTTALVGGIVFVKESPLFCSSPLKLSFLLKLVIFRHPSRPPFFLLVASLCLLRCSSDIFSLRFELWLRSSLWSTAIVSRSTCSLTSATLSLSRSGTAENSSSCNSSLRFCSFSHCWNQCRYTVSSYIFTLCLAIL